MTGPLDCRSCVHYSFDRDVDIETFRCNRGYFDFTEGPTPEQCRGTAVSFESYHCGGSDFSPKLREKVPIL